MTSAELSNLAKAGLLKSEPGNQSEFDGLLKSGAARLNDALNPALANESRFDLAYNAGHAFSLAALRWHGFRASKRYVVFQALVHTLAQPNSVWRVLDKSPQLRNSAEYEGEVEVDETFLKELIDAVKIVRDAVSKLGPIPPSS